MKSHFWQKILLFALSGTLIIGGVGLFLFPAPQLSERENRMLAGIPHWQDASAGEYFEKWNLYAAERLPGKEGLRSLKALLELLQYKGESNGVMPVQGGGLVRPAAGKSLQVLHRNIKGIHKIRAAAKARQIPMTIAIAPRASEVTKLPTFYRIDLEKAANASIKEQLSEAVLLGEGMPNGAYYRTDHHWNATGVWHAYLSLSPLLGFEPILARQEVLTENFRGTTDAAGGIPFIPPDTIATWRYEGDEALTVIKDGAPAPALYDSEKLLTRDKYAVFHGAGTGKTELRLRGEDTRPTLVVIKDSFANALLPLLAAHFHVVALDPRYLTSPIEAELCHADALLVLCGIQSLADTAFLK